MKTTTALDQAVLAYWENRHPIEEDEGEDYWDFGGEQRAANEEYYLAQAQRNADNFDELGPTD